MLASPAVGARLCASLPSSSGGRPPPLQVGVLDLRPGQAGVGPDPGIGQAQAGDAGVATAVRVEQGRGGGVAQAPQDDATQRRPLALPAVDCGGDVVVHLVERAPVAVGVAHAAIVDAQAWHPSRGKCPAQQRELPVTAGPVLRTANDQQHTDVRGPRSVDTVGGRLAQHADQRVARAIDAQHVVAVQRSEQGVHAATASTGRGAKSAPAVSAARL